MHNDLSLVNVVGSAVWWEEGEGGGGWFSCVEASM